MILLRFTYSGYPHAIACLFVSIIEYSMEWYLWSNQHFPNLMHCSGTLNITNTADATPFVLQAWVILATAFGLPVPSLKIVIQKTRRPLFV